jgi:hypothetical protein
LPRLVAYSLNLLGIQGSPRREYHNCLRDKATDSGCLGNGRRLERFYPFLAPNVDRQVIRALRITYLRLHTHVTDSVIDVLVETSDLERLETTVYSDIQGLDDVGEARRYNDNEIVVVGKSLCVEGSDVNAV